MFTKVKKALSLAATAAPLIALQAGVVYYFTGQVRSATDRVGSSVQAEQLCERAVLVVERLRLESEGVAHSDEPGLMVQSLSQLVGTLEESHQLIHEASWREDPPASALAEYQTTIERLKKALGRLGVAASQKEREGVKLLRQSIYVDDAASRVDEAIAELGNALDQQTAEANRRLESAYARPVTAALAAAAVATLFLLFRTAKQQKQHEDKSKQIADLTAAAQSGQLVSAGGLGLDADLAALATAVQPSGTENTGFDSVRQVASDLIGQTHSIASSNSRLSEEAQLAKRQSTAFAESSHRMRDAMVVIEKNNEAAQTRVENVIDAVQSMREKLATVSDSADEAAQISRNASSLANESNQQIEVLDQAAGEIGNVTRLISDIAFQTNLLALNAAIEAARAGKAGLGFGIVANQVKDLADKTSEATSEISSKISGIQQTTAESVESIGRISKVIGDVTTVSASIAQAVEDQTQTAGTIAMRATSLMESAMETAEGIENSTAISQQIDGSVDSFNEIVDLTAEHAAQAQTAFDQMAGKADELEQAIAQIN